MRLRREFRGAFLFCGLLSPSGYIFDRSVGGWLMFPIVGGVIMGVGAILWCGNVFGFLHTFPLAGYLTMAVGGAVMKIGKKG